MAISQRLVGPLRFVRPLMVMIAVLLAPGGHAKPESDDTSPKRASNPAVLTVTTRLPRDEMWIDRIKASGRIVPWQEAVVSAETGGLKVVAVAAEVGDVVEKGQVLATLATDIVNIDLARAEARVAQADAKREEARANANRSRSVQSSGALSHQQLEEYRILEKMAEANLAIEQANREQERLRLSHTRITAPDDGVVSARLVSLGQVVQPGTELYRLIRQSRLLWVAEIAVEDLPRIAPGQRAEVTLPGQSRALGSVQRISPQLDNTSLNAWVSISLDKDPEIKAGMYVTGHILLGESAARTVPEQAIVWRDGKSFLFSLDRAVSPLRVVRHQVTLGRRYNAWVEVLSGLPPAVEIVESGAAFLADGDVVRWAETRPATP